MTDRYETGHIAEGQFQAGWVICCELPEYFAAIQAGLDNYEPMKAIFRQVLHETQLNSNG